MSKNKTGRLSQDQVFEVLKSPRRRYVLYYLQRHGGKTDLSEITEQVAAWENDTTIAELGRDQRKRVYISLYQTHLPKLDNAGIVEYDQDDGMVSLATRARELDNYLGNDTRSAFPWDRYYLGLSLASAVLLVGVWLDVSLFAQVTVLSGTLVIAAAFAVSALVQRFQSHHRRRTELPPEIGSTKT